MTAIEITVSAVYPQQPGKPKGAIKDSSGRYWSVWPKDLGSFTIGQSYLIQEYDAYKAQSGKTYNTVKRFQPISGMQSQPSPAGAPRHGSGSDNERRMDIFICGAFNNLMANPNVNPTAMEVVDMVSALQNLKRAWLGVFGPAPLPNTKHDPISTSPRRDDMNDDIPF